VDGRDICVILTVRRTHAVVDRTIKLHNRCRSIEYREGVTAGSLEDDLLSHRHLCPAPHSGAITRGGEARAKR